MSTYPVLRLAVERRRRGWSQTALAHHPDLQLARPRLRQTYISEIERGLRNPTASQREGLARALGIEPTALLEPVGPEETEEVG